MATKQTTAEAVHAAMVAMGEGRISADEYRATMRAMRLQVGESAFMVAKFAAIAMGQS